MEEREYKREVAARNEEKKSKEINKDLTSDPAHKVNVTELKKEVGGRAGLEPTRYGDWEKNGIISDF